MLDLETLTAPIDGDASVGPNLRNESAFRDLEDSPGRFAEKNEADLRRTIKECSEYLERTKDQLPAIIALQAAVRLADFAEALTALRVIEHFASNYWDDFHPGPANEMLIGRINELTALSRPAAMVLPLQRATVARMPSPSNLMFTAGMVAQACKPTPEWTEDDDTELAAQVESGKLTNTVAKSVRLTRDGGRTLRMIARSVSNAVRDADQAAGIVSEDPIPDAADARQIAYSLRDQVSSSREQLSSIQDALESVVELYRSNADDSPSFGPIQTQLKIMVEDFDRFISLFEESAASSESVDVPVQAAGAPVGPNPARTAEAKRGFVAGVPTSREEVVEALDAVCRYYASNEPASPVPVMLRRVRGWVQKDFLGLIEEISPSAFDDARKFLASPGE